MSIDHLPNTELASVVISHKKARLCSLPILQSPYLSLTRSRFEQQIVAMINFCLTGRWDWHRCNLLSQVN